MTISIAEVVRSPAPDAAQSGGPFNDTHTSHMGVLRPPFTPTDHLVRLDYASGNRFGGRFGVGIAF